MWREPHGVVLNLGELSASGDYTTAEPAITKLFIYFAFPSAASCDTFLQVFKGPVGIRLRVLAIAAVPSLVLLTIGTGTAIHLATSARVTERWAESIQNAVTPSMNFIVATQRERQLSLLKTAGDKGIAAELGQQRSAVDESMRLLADAASSLHQVDAGAVDSEAGAVERLARQASSIRRGVDDGTKTAAEVNAFFDQWADAMFEAISTIIQRSPDQESAFAQTVAGQLLIAEDAMSRGAALGSLALSTGGLAPDELREFDNQIGSSQTDIARLQPRLTPDEQTRVQQIIASPEWRQMLAGTKSIRDHAALEAAGFDSTTAPVSVAAWRQATNQVCDDLLDIWRSHQLHAQRLAQSHGSAILRNSILGGIATLLATIAAFVISMRLANNMVRRLKSLRAQTLAAADEQLPALMERLDRGESVDPDADVAYLHFGSDEIGQVADAFNRAQLAAVSAAVTEAKTRGGVTAVFLNIAHRSQSVMYRQLEVLYRAEYEYDDPELLELLFQLDNLATRERRNAENLIILGGEQPRRRWRKPVPLLELMRSAVAETQGYTRVRITELPDVRVIGTAVADLVHLLAELLDNATDFSPPQTPVHVHGGVVGRGVAIEIVDQGLGIPSDQIEKLNETLCDPPDFTVETLSSDSRLGLFVVARLAARHEVKVRLTESEYGGTRAIVLIPTALLATDDTDGAEAPDPAPEQHPRLDGSPWPPVAHGRPERGRTADSPREISPAHIPGRTTAAPSQHTPEILSPSPGDRPPLPRRRKQQSIAPQLAGPTPATPGQPSGTERSSEQTRELYSAIENGTRQGRRLTGTTPDTKPEYGRQT
ncbi:nitrate- and nitrite sensing domain-containing protein [Nocardia aobensis]|uniref:histidine kinase n=1 Tax=Nocardia aobensis TaxID=257277 RepID=A0ABW6P9Q4_9NOCA